MLKITVITIVTAVFLSACSNPFKSKYANVEVIDKSAISGGIVIAKDPSFKSENLAQTSNINTQTADQKAIAELRASNIAFVLYFPYDDAEIDQASTKEIIKHADFMRNNLNVRLRLEGHADERGTREYNLALGENRALSIREVLGLYGLNKRIKVVSFGEEKPNNEGHDEQSWGENRRVEFVY